MASIAKPSDPPKLMASVQSLRRDKFLSLARRWAIFHIPALVFAILLQSPDWPAIVEAIYGYPMVDRNVYETQLLTRNLPIDFLPDFDLLTYFTYELVWNKFIAFLNRDLGFSTDAIFFLITTLVIWRFAFMIATVSGWIYVFLLINPLVIDFAFSQLRLATAIALASFFWRRENASILKMLGYAALTTIHTSMVLFAAIHYLAHYVAAPRFRNLVILVFAGFMIALAIGPAREMILSAIGDRRADYQDMSSSLLYLSFWILLWAMLMLQWRNSMATLDGRFAIIILSIVALNSALQGYSTRFIVAAFPSIIVAMAGWRSQPISLPLALFLPYAAMQWMYWLRLN